MYLKLNQASADCPHPQHQPDRHKQYAAMRIFGTRRFVGSSTTGHSTLQTCDQISAPVLISRGAAEFSVLGACRQRAGSARELSTHAVRLAVSMDQFARPASVAFP